MPCACASTVLHAAGGASALCSFFSSYNGTMNMRNKKWENDFSPIDPDGCDIDRLHSKAYLHHLFKAQELLAMQIASIHNLAFYLRLVTDARQHIEQGDFVQWKRSVIDNLGRRI
jgi:queuine tRNA-ribosyltransferase